MKNTRDVLIVFWTICICIVALQEARGENVAMHSGLTWNDTGEQAVLTSSSTQFIIIDAKGHRIQTINFDSPVYCGLLSPNKDKLVYTTDEAFWMLTISTNEKKQIASGKIGFIHWSPDSLSVVYSMEEFQEENGQKIWVGSSFYVVDVEGGEPRRIYP